MMRFHNRIEAGRRLAGELEHLRGQDLVIVGLPRGGVPVAFEVAVALDAPLDIILVRKLGLPGQTELAMGAIGEGGARVVDEDLVARAGVSAALLQAVEARERVELERRVERFRLGRPRLSLRGRTVVIVDDGIATGATARTACEVARAHGAARIVLAVPVAPVGWTLDIDGSADEFVCVQTPDPFISVGRFYFDFDQTTDDEVTACLDRAAARVLPSTVPVAASEPGPVDEEVDIRIDGVRLRGHLNVPERATGLVVFAHGSGSSRHSPRNQMVAELLGDAGIATLLFDLLTTEEEADRFNVFDIELLARRLAAVTGWLRGRAGVVGLPIGYFGASTGAAAAIWAAAEPDSGVAAVVSRGGRVDLADERVHALGAPTMLIVGSKDVAVLDLNRRTRSRMHCENELVVIPGATHLFEERGTLTMAATEAKRWFTDHFGRASAGKGVGHLAMGG